MSVLNAIKHSLMVCLIFMAEASQGEYVSLNGTVTDTLTGLMWDKCALGQVYRPDLAANSQCAGSGSVSNLWSATQLSWGDALKAVVMANARGHRGYSDWRLPNINELDTIFQPGDGYIPGFYEAFPNRESAAGGFWWSSTLDRVYEQSGTPIAWAETGNYAYYSINAWNVDYKLNVRLVRGGDDGAGDDAQAGEPVALLSVSKSTLKIGEFVYLWVTVKGNTETGKTPTGTVTFMDNGTVLTATRLNSSSRAYTYVNTLSAGAHVITVVYPGDANNPAVGSNSVAVTVGSTDNRANSNTTLTTSGQSATYGENVTLTATVTGSKPTGLIDFKDGENLLARKSLTSGIAAYSLKSLAAGTHSLTAVYSGDANNTASTTESAVTVEIAKADQAPLTATVTPSTLLSGRRAIIRSSGGSGTGLITYAATATGGINCTINNTNYLTPTGGTGTCEVTVTRAESANYKSATSAPVSVPVTINTTTTALSASASSSTYGQSLTFTASITGTSPSGTVVFKEGEAVLATRTVSSGKAVWTTTTLNAGAHYITAVYSGDANNTASTTESAVTVEIAKANQAPLTVTVNPSSLVSGGPRATLGRIGGSGDGLFTYAATATGGINCTINSIYLTATGGAGTCELTVTRAESANYKSATSAPVSVPVSP